ncbi:4Fe-4S binding protein [Hydrogenimonas urashimensis]|uniref:4Fe-4S binding protein n=1 Tax=Hydrogenimonas urashimensis TaxID=2740515 RepID=UPI00191623CD|nr:4Fe-4S binding protein [Hydrogenimonas urashimensis]
MRNEAMTEGNLFKFDYFKCLRSDYAKNECTICIDLCPEEAMVFDRKKLTLDTERCTACAACVGSCPTEALASEVFDPNRFSLEFASQQKPLISCKENVPCLSALSSEHFIAIALRKEGGVECDLSHCAECSVNKDGKVLASIEASIAEANRFLEMFGFERLVSMRHEAQENAPDAGRRMLFKKLANAVKEAGEEDGMRELIHLNDEKQPLKRILLKNALKKVSESFPKETTREAAFSFVVGKKIDAISCNNCQECAMFCPTDALSILKDNTGILFQMGKCIACGICNDVCQPRSITDDNSFDLVDFAFDRMQILVKHRLEICEECKVAFSYHGGEKVCDRCKEFKENFSDLFTMAKDLE